MTFEPQIVLLMLFTLIVVLAFGIWQYRKAQKAKQNKSHSSITEGQPELRRTDGAPGVKPR